MAESAFWQFSLAFYARPGVAPECLALQDECGVDVNVALYLLFLARQGRAIDAGDMAAVIGIAAPWSDAVVAPLRSVRRRMKGGSPGFAAPSTQALRAEVKRVELQAERLLQETLESLCRTPGFAGRHAPAHAAAEANLARYAEFLGVAPGRFRSLLEHFRTHRDPAGPA